MEFFSRRTQNDAFCCILDKICSVKSLNVVWKNHKKMEISILHIYICQSHNVNEPSFFLAFRTYSFRHWILMWVWKGSKRDTLMAFFRKRDTWKTEKIDVKTWSLVQRVSYLWGTLKYNDTNKIVKFVII